MHHSIQNQWQAYTTRLTHWDTRASVRQAPMRKYTPVEGARSFSKELIALMRHDIVVKADTAIHHVLETQKLYSYLGFTEKLERRAVMPVCVNLAEGEMPFKTPRSLQRDASKIVTDEAHHAECAVDLTDQIADVTGEMPLVLGRPEFLNKLDAAARRFDGIIQQLAFVTFTAVSETLITGTLTRVPADRAVHPVIREVLMDHARDEGRHQACFSDVIRIMWDQLDVRERDAIGPLFPEFVETFLAPDLNTEFAWLRVAGFDQATARKIIEETYEDLDLSASYRDQARPTISMLKRFGLLDHAATFDAAAKRGLVE
jgi:hypothetical protein